MLWKPLSLSLCHPNFLLKISLSTKSSGASLFAVITDFLTRNYLWQTSRAPTTALALLPCPRSHHLFIATMHGRPKFWCKMRHDSYQLPITGNLDLEVESLRWSGEARSRNVLMPTPSMWWQKHSTTLIPTNAQATATDLAGIYRDQHSPIRADRAIPVWFHILSTGAHTLARFARRRAASATLVYSYKYFNALVHKRGKSCFVRKNSKPSQRMVIDAFHSFPYSALGCFGRRQHIEWVAPTFLNSRDSFLSAIGRPDSRIYIHRRETQLHCSTT